MDFHLGRRKNDHEQIYVPRLTDPHMRRTNFTILVNGKVCRIYGEVDCSGEWVERFFAYEQSQDGSLIGHRVYRNKVRQR